MRPTRTPSEQHAISAIVAKLMADGHQVTELADITDRPDAALQVDGRIVAVECRTFTSERLLRLHGIDQPEGKIFQIYLPLEPHVWVQGAIEAKAAKVREYKERCGASAVWLVLHSARGIFNHLSAIFEQGLADLFYIAVCSRPHPFERIYLTGEYDLPPVCIFQPEESPIHRKKYQKMKVKRIPIERYFFSKVIAIEAPNGQGQITMNFDQTIEQNFLLQPLDKRFRIDYTEIASVQNAFIAQKSLPHLVYAEPIESVGQEGSQ